MQLAERMSRLGTESAFEVLARAHEAAPRQGRSIINLGIGQPDFPTPEHIVEAAQKALRDGHHGYTPANGILPLREAVAEDIPKRRGVEVDPDRIVIVPGGKVTMFFAITMFGEPGAEIMYPDPGFPIYRSVIEFTGAKAVPIPLYEDSGFSFSAEEVLAKITPRTRLIIVNSPANPDRRRGAQGRARPAGRGPRRASRRSSCCRTRSTPACLRRRAARQHAALSGDRGPADPARRLVQDLRHDRLAPGLRGLARRTWSSTRRGSRSTSTPASTPRPSGPASRRSKGRRTRSTAWSRRSTSGARSSSSALNALPGLPLRAPGRRLLRLPQHRRHRLSARASCRTSC